MTDLDNIDIEGDFSLDSNALSESSSILQNDFKPLWTPDAGMSTEQRNEIERILLEDTISSHRSSFLDSPSGRHCWSPEEERNLLRLLDEHGKKWAKVAKQLNRSILEVKMHAEKISTQTRQRAFGRRRTNPVMAIRFDSPSTSTRQTLQSSGEIVTIEKHENSDEEIQVEDEDEQKPQKSSIQLRGKTRERLVTVNVKQFQRPSSHSQPNAELQLDPYRIFPFEEEANADYFNGKSSQKTPERYLKIRNHIIAQWNKQKPKYINKTTSRIGLKNCGDVNCVGLIHDYLEKVGAINFGCPQVKEEKKPMNQPEPVPRARKKRRVNPSFVSQADIQVGGCTMEHDSVTGEVIAKTLITKDSKSGKSTNRQSNPLKLVSCLRYDADCQPFEVEIHAASLIVAQSHSHQSHSEVMGLLGGHHQEGQLRVVAALPTKAVANGRECDMDPVSQCEALDTIRGWGLDVVGWYHSHPKFAPQPSMRDLTSQVDMQDMFTCAGAPFIALIFSPYFKSDKITNRLSSTMTCFVVEKHHLTADYCPFSLKPKIVRGESIGPSLESTLEVISGMRNRCADLVDLEEKFNDEWSCLEKMMATLQLCLLKSKYSQAETTALLSRIHSMFVKK